MSVKDSSDPALAPPPGVEPNFVNPETLWRENVAAQTVCLTIASVVFFLRCYARLGFNKRHRYWIFEDWMVALSFTALVVNSALVTRIIIEKGGADQWNVTVGEARRQLFFFWIDSILYGLAILFTKVAILLMYIRVFSVRHRRFLWWAIWSLIAVCTMFYLSITLVKIWQCHPREKIWIKSMPGSCINVGILLNISGIFNTATDVIILIIPIKSVWALQLSWKKKTGVIMIFTIGAVAPIFSLVGVVIRFQTASSRNSTRNLPLVPLWACAEITTGVVCACLPALPSLFRRKPSSQRPVSATSFASRRRITNPMTSDLDYHSSRYFELDESTFRPGASQEGTVFSSIKGGLVLPDVSTTDVALSEDKSDGSEGSHVQQDTSHGIVKTVHIEQSRE